MADSMCGPSNALQNFQKHSTIDRTLQQDRLLSRQSPSQGFRSSPGPNAGLLERDFESFQAGQLPLDHGFQPNTFQHAPPSLQQGGPVNWATDFQRMNVPSSSPQTQQQPMGMQASQRIDTGGWHQDFAWQQNQTSGGTQLPSYADTGYQYQPGMTGMSSRFYRDSGPQTTFEQPMQASEAFDEAAFQRAFDEASKAEMDTLEESTQNMNLEVGQDILVDASSEAPLKASDDLALKSDELRSQKPIGADTIQDHRTPSQDQSRDDPEELARTAAKLLNSVQHDQSTKFQNSQFLSLMRQFRDREKTVEGDSVVSKGRIGEESMTQEGYQLMEELYNALRDLVVSSDRTFMCDAAGIETLLSVFLMAIPTIAEESGGRTHAEKCTAILGSLLKKRWGADLRPMQNIIAYLMSKVDASSVSIQKWRSTLGNMTRRDYDRIAAARYETNIDALLGNLPTSHDQDQGQSDNARFMEHYISLLLRDDLHCQDLELDDSRLITNIDGTVHEAQETLHGVLSREDVEIAARFGHAREICESFGMWSRELAPSEVMRFLEMFGGERVPDVGVVEAEVGRLRRVVASLEGFESFSLPTTSQQGQADTPTGRFGSRATFSEFGEHDFSNHFGINDSGIASMNDGEKESMRTAIHSALESENVKKIFLETIAEIQEMIRGEEVLTQLQTELLAVYQRWERERRQKSKTRAVGKGSDNNVSENVANGE